ncbi:MAG: hypothetical protein JSY10_10370 [Paenibacillus sp.]|nr:hypothetical protein [Paenibacillus sp.]
MPYYLQPTRGFVLAALSRFLGFAPSAVCVVAGPSVVQTADVHIWPIVRLSATAVPFNTTLL